MSWFCTLASRTNVSPSGTIDRTSSYTDTCVSDVQVFVDGEDKYNVAAEVMAQEEIRRFTAERARAGKELKASKGKPLSRLEFSSAPAARLKLPAAQEIPKASGWRRVGVQLPPGARAQADTMDDSI